MNAKKITTFSVLSICLSAISLAQTLPVGFPLVEDFLRREQLKNAFDSTVSFTQRPLRLPEETLSEFDVNITSNIYSNPSLRLLLLSPQLDLKYNSHHPYQINDGSMIPSKGLQAGFTPGIAGDWKFLSFQFRPEIIYSQNRDYPGFPVVDETVWPYHLRWPMMYQWWNRIDLPEQFGDGSYKKLLPGQSFVSINYKHISFGYSTQNLWWGPGKFNSLLMTNNSQGFRHFTIKTNEALITKFGALEFQFVGGKLTNSGFLPPDTSKRFNGVQLYQPKANDWRYINGASFSFQPKGLRGIYVGFNSTIQQYSSTAEANNDYIPIISNIFRSSDHFGDTLIHQKMNSVFLRFVMLNHEFYFEYGRNSNGWDWEDFFLNPQHNSGYVVGLSKLIPSADPSKFFEINVELTKLQQPGDYIIAIHQPISWYTHDAISHGYTNNGEVLGSGLGPGGNSQTIEINKVTGLNKVGFIFERRVHNNDFYFIASHGSRGGDFRSFWIDYRLGFSGSWVLSRMMFSTQANFIRSLNYQWETVPNSPYFAKDSGIDRSNLTFNLNVAYLF